MKFLRYLFAGLIAVLPMLWLDDYTITNPVWWTVISAWHLGTLFGYFEHDEEN